MRPSGLSAVAAAAAFAAIAVFAAGDAVATEPSQPQDWATSPAYRYGRLGRQACEAELVQRGVPFQHVAEARGVLAPVRLAGPLRGVTFRTELPARQRPSSPYEIADCRLVLALDDFAQILSSHDVVEVHHFSMYRPPGARWPAGKAGSRHAGGLAIDAGKLVKKDGTVLDVERDFHGRIGNETCGPGTGPDPATPEAIELRAIVCDAAQKRLFNVELTPDYNYEHRNHFHLEVTADARWFLVH
jgi:hypothetical protein